MGIKSYCLFVVLVTSTSQISSANPTKRLWYAEVGVNTLGAAGSAGLTFLGQQSNSQPYFLNLGVKTSFGLTTFPITGTDLLVSLEHFSIAHGTYLSRESTSRNLLALGIRQRIIENLHIDIGYGASRTWYKKTGQEYCESSGNYCADGRTEPLIYGRCEHGKSYGFHLSGGIKLPKIRKVSVDNLTFEPISIYLPSHSSSSYCSGEKYRQKRTNFDDWEITALTTLSIGFY